MKALIFFFLFFVSSFVFSQGAYMPLDGDRFQVTDSTIWAVIKKAQIENKIQDMNLVKKGQRITFCYPNGGRFTHTFAKGECVYIIVKNYLTIPFYEEMRKPRKQMYHRM